MTDSRGMLAVDDFMWLGVVGFWAGWFRAFRSFFSLDVHPGNFPVCVVATQLWGS